MTHQYTNANDYLLQLPYLNDSGNARVVHIKWHDARELVEAGSHRLLHADAEIYLLTPISPPAVGYRYQIGCEAV